MSQSGCSPREQLIRIQKRIVRDLRREIFASFSGSSAELRAYRRAHERGLESYARIVDRRVLLDALSAASVAVVGDFHSLPSSQQAVLALVEDLARRRRVVLALEMVPQERQLALDAFLAGQIGEGAFLRAVDWEECWGFEWRHYRPIFELAREHELQVYGVNTCAGLDGADRLRQRDEIAAAAVVRAVHAHPGSLVVVVVGDFHVASGHLPAALRRSLARLRRTGEVVLVHQNADELYWELASHRLERGAEVLEVAAGEYALVNSTPIAKYQSYFHWEAGVDELLGGGELGSLSSPLRVAEEVRCLAAEIASYLGVADAESDDLVVYTASDLDLLADLRRLSGIRPGDIRELRRQLARQESYFIGGAKVIYLADFSLDHAAEEAAHFVHHAANPHPRRALAPRTDFYCRTMREALGYFGSKVANPSRAHYSEEDYRELASSLRHENLDPSLAFLAQVARFVIQHLDAEAGFVARGRLPRLRAIHHQREELHLGVTHALGYVLGERLYQAVSDGLVTVGEARSLYLRPLDTDGAAEDLYFALRLELTERQRAKLRRA